MAHTLRRDEIIRVLTDAGIQFDPEATIVQLRPLYDGVLANLNRDNVQPVDNNLPAANDVPAADVNVNANLGPQQQQQPAAQQMPAVNQMPEVNQLSAANQVNQMQIDEVNAQIALAQRKRELMQIQREIQALERRKFDFRAFESMVNPFNGDDTYDVDKWFNDLEDAFAVFSCSESDKLVAARSLIKGTAKVFLRTIRIATYDELKVELTSEFRQAFTAHEIYQQLKERKRKPDESLKHYVSIMVEIASHASIPETDVVDLIVEGLQDISANVAILYGAKTVAELKELLKRYEKLVRVQTKSDVNMGASTSRSAFPKQTGSSAKPAAKPAAPTAANQSASANPNASANGSFI